MTKDWWKTFFEEDFAQIFLAHDPHELEQIVRFLKKNLHLKKGDELFDQCSGIGNVSHALVRRGFRTIGVEQSKLYVLDAQRVAEQEGLPCTFYCDDALHFVAEHPVDGAFNWYTSFGYYADDAQNIAMLAQAFKSLKPGGWFALDFHNPLYILRGNLSIRKYTKKIDGKMVRVVRKSWVDMENGMLTSEWCYQFPGKPTRTRSGTTRLYMPTELKQLFARAGFRDLRFFGDVNENPLSMESPRCIVVAQKPL